MRFEVLVSTMHQIEGDYSLLKKMNIQTDAVVINQCDRNGKEEIEFNGKKITWINTNDRGLSKSRNMAIANSTADICLIADDDEIFLNGFEDIILKSFENNPDFDLIRFKVHGIEKEFKKYQKKACRINMRLSLKISSVEVAFRRKKINEMRLRFDELIGAGTEFFMGEENVFLIDFLRKKGRAWYFPIDIAELHIGNSSWFTGFNEKYYLARGASYAAISPVGGYVLSVLFALSHTKDTKLSVFVTCGLMFRGARKYLRKKKGLQYE